MCMLDAVGAKSPQYRESRGLMLRVAAHVLEQPVICSSDALAQLPAVRRQVRRGEALPQGVS